MIAGAHHQGHRLTPDKSFRSTGGVNDTRRPRRSRLPSRDRITAGRAFDKLGMMRIAIAEDWLLASPNKREIKKVRYELC
jgi:hypothetical protein